jgi:alanyl-tRNA synthetase
MRIPAQHDHLVKLRFFLRFSRQHHSAGPLSAKAIRQSFIDYFVQDHGHTFLRSSPVVPFCDPTVAFVNAGMNQVIQIPTIRFMMIMVIISCSSNCIFRVHQIPDAGRHGT